MIEILAAVAICTPIAWPMIREWRRADQQKKTAEEDAQGTDITAETYDERVREILTACMCDLRAQHASGFGPWIPACLDGANTLDIVDIDARGRIKVERPWTGCSPAVALTAVKWTLKELAGSRFKTAKLQEAVALLESINE